MISAAPTFRQIKAQVNAIRSKPGLENATVFGIQSTGRWTGERLRTDGKETYLIAQCDSPLEIRLTLQSHLPDVTAKVLVTGLTTEALGNDILVRLTKRRLFPIRSW